LKASVGEVGSDPTECALRFRRRDEVGILRRVGNDRPAEELVGGIGRVNDGVEPEGMGERDVRVGETTFIDQLDASHRDKLFSAAGSGDEGGGSLKP
jgi:hypothetical protein